MIKVLFVCLGNICRSPMAEAIFKDMVAKEGLANQIQVDSAATSTYQEGNPTHEGTRKRLAIEGISVDGIYSRPLNDKDLEADYIIGMDDSNMDNIVRFIDKRPVQNVHKLLEFADRDDDIADPYYTGDFDITYTDVVEGCRGLLETIKASLEL